MAGATNIDSQLSDMVTGSKSCGEHALDRAREYAATAHFIGLLAGVVGSSEEQKEARETVMAALADIGFSADDAENRKIVKELNREWYKLKYETPTASMSASERAVHDAKITELDDAISSNPVVQKWSPQGVYDQLWSSLADIYNRAVKFIREDMWKKSACELALDAGFAILETGVAAALTAAGLAAAAAFLKVVAIVSKGSRLVTISVKATRGLKGGAAARNPAHKLGSERTYPRKIDTGEVSPDAKKLLDESGQGNGTKADRSPAKGEEGPKATPPKAWKPKEVLGRRVYQRNDLIDPNGVDPTTGLTNRQLMQNGRAPIGSDGFPIELHHMVQQEGLPFNNAMAPLAEVSRTFHSKNYNAIHIYPRGDPDYISWRKINPANARRYDKYREAYWIKRAEDFAPK